jgi:hypothetical protein
VCKSYVTTTKDAPNDLQVIIVEAGSVKCVLELLELVIPRSDNGNIPSYSGKAWSLKWSL